jgi:hypothetical protein
MGVRPVPVTDYYPLLARAIAALDTNTAGSRRALYDRARAAQIAQLRKRDPALTKSEIAREHEALEHAVRDVEAEAAQAPGNGFLPTVGQPSFKRARPTAFSPTARPPANPSSLAGTTLLSPEAPPTRAKQLRQGNPTSAAAELAKLAKLANAIEQKLSSNSNANGGGRQLAERFEALERPNLPIHKSLATRKIGAQKQTNPLSPDPLPRPLPPSLEQTLYATITKKLIEAFDGRLPTWEEFKQASQHGRVRGSTSLAFYTMWWSGMPTGYAIFYGFFVALTSLLVIPFAVGLYFFAGISGWWIIASIAVAVYLFGVTKEGAGRTMITGAQRDERLYQMLVIRGAFLFEPSDVEAPASPRPSPWLPEPT